MKAAVKPKLKAISFARLSRDNASYATRDLIVSNGMRFVALIVPVAELRIKTTALYIHVRRATGQCYIGITEQRVMDRWTKGNNYRQQRRFGSAIRKYGWDAFDHHVLAFGNSRTALERAEVRAIRLAGGHRSRYTYNLSPGGDLVAENDRPVIALHLPTHRQRRFHSAADAARKLGFRNVDAAAAVARGERTSKEGWWFRFEDENDRYPPESWGEELRLERIRQRFGRRVVAISLTTGERRLFPTFSDAAATLDVNPSLVSASVRKKVRSAGGWCFFNEGDDERLPLIYGSALTREKRDRKVFAICLKTGRRRSFRNCTLADRELGVYAGAAAAVAAGTRVSAAGWFFSYNENDEPPKEYRGQLVAKLKRKPVVATNVITDEERSFGSAKEAAIALQISRAAISKSISGAKAAKGYRFRFV